ncbi:MAG: hypothetical protein ACKV2U_28590, partial [Bryobacteraceae bacterium]
AVQDERARTALWDFVQRGIAKGQALIAITWRKDPRDLPRLGSLLAAPANDPVAAGLYSLSYAMRNAYGDAALPSLETALLKSGYVGVQTDCARELMLAGRPSGFAFAAQAIERKESYKQEMTQFVRDNFIEMRTVDEAAVLAFLKQRAK